MDLLPNKCYRLVIVSRTLLSRCGSGLVDPIYETRQLPTGRPGRMQRSLKCEMLFLGIHRMQKWGSGENKSRCILNSLALQWLCNQVTLLYFVFHQQAISQPENVSRLILIAAHLSFKNNFLFFPGLLFTTYQKIYNERVTGGCMCVSVCVVMCFFVHCVHERETGTLR